MRFFHSILSLIFLLGSVSVQAQKCGTHAPTSKEYAFTRDVVANIPTAQFRNAGTTCVPIQAHVVTMDDGSGGITYEQLNIGLTFLNAKFYDSGIEFYYSGLPNVANNSDLYDFNEQTGDNDTEAQLKALFPTASDAVNIYYVNAITLSNGFSAAGYAYFPNNTASSNVVVMVNDFTYNNPNGTYTHEFGHYFNLFHTHESTEFGNTNANAENVPRTGANANCSTRGDLLCDTEADPRFNSMAFDFGSCTDTGGETDVNGVPYNHPVDNVMSYYPDQCVTRFTPDQYTRMTQGLMTRLGHSAYSLNAPPMSVATPSGLAVALNGSSLDLTWNDNASNEMGYVIERSTTSATDGFRALLFGATGVGGTSYSDNTLSSNTTYWYRIKPTNGDCNTYSNVATFTTGLFYCTPTYTTPCDGAFDVSLDEFTLTGETANISNINSNCSPEGFGDFTTQSANVIAGSTYNFSLSALSGAGAFFNQSAQIWIDFNQNGSFEDAGETMLASLAVLDPSASGTITIPVTALNGTTRLRVRSFEASNGCSGLTSCNNCPFGETEDYSITISGGVTPGLVLDLKVFLEGPYNGTDMNDDLRAGSFIPSNEPYSTIFNHMGDGGLESVSNSVLAVTGSNAIVDWVMVELRDKSNNTSVLSTRSALLQRDGDIVDTDGASSLIFTESADSYYIAVRHRNHNGIMTSSAVALSGSSAVIDFTSPATTTFGTDAQKNIAGVNVMWMGNVTADTEIKYVGSANDRDPILVAIGGNSPTTTLSGYLMEDTNLDGEAKYVGASNDRDPILVNIGGSSPTVTKAEQLP